MAANAENLCYYRRIRTRVLNTIMTPFTLHLLTFLAVVAFASNSVLCRLALGDGYIDPASFSSIRIASGALLLTILLKANRTTKKDTPVNWNAGFTLFVYVFFFSVAYVELSVSTGALVLFLTMQIVFLIFGFMKGERPSLISVFGFVVAFCGFVILVLPGVDAPTPRGLVMMIIAGVAASIYSVYGKATKEPLEMTKNNFVVAFPLATALFFWALLNSQQLSSTGIILAVFSGAYASAIGYILWYKVIPHLTYFQASTTHLGVPLVSAIAGVVLLDETLTLNFAFAGLLILSGFLLTIKGRGSTSTDFFSRHQQ